MRASPFSTPPTLSAAPSCFHSLRWLPCDRVCVVLCTCSLPGIGWHRPSVDNQYHPLSPFKYLLSFFKRFYLFIFRERGWEGERAGEKHHCLVALTWPPLGTWPTTRTCALTGNPTSDPLVRGPCSVRWVTPARVVFIFFVLLCHYFGGTPEMESTCVQAIILNWKQNVTLI